MIVMIVANIVLWVGLIAIAIQEVRAMFGK